MNNYWYGINKTQKSRSWNTRKYIYRKNIQHSMKCGSTDSGLSECGQTDSGSKDTAQGNAAYRNAAKLNEIPSTASTGPLQVPGYGGAGDYSVI